MKRLFLVIGMTIMILPWLSGARAEANPIYFDFSSQLSSVPNSAVQYNGTLSFTPAYQGGNDFAWLTASQGTHVAEPSSITIANLSWQDDYTPGTTPSTFNSQSFGLALTLTDEASHAQGTLHFLGNFSGSLGGWPEGGTLTFTPSIQTLTLGHNLYTVDLHQQTSWNTQNWTGELEDEYVGLYGVSAEINVKPLNVNSAPEPSSLLLACLGLPPLRLARCFRRRRVVDGNASKA